MLSEQLTFEDAPGSKKFKSSIQSIQDGKFDQAFKLFEEIIQLNIQLPDIFPIMKGLRFWMVREKKIQKIPQGVKRSEYLQTQFDEFLRFLEKRNHLSTTNIIHFQKAIYRQIIDNYIYHFQNDGQVDIDFFLKLAEAFLSIEDYTEAIQTLHYGKKYNRQDSRSYYLLYKALKQQKKDKQAMHSLYLAFLYDPQRIPLEAFEEKIICDKIHELEQLGHDEYEISLWLPVSMETENLFSPKPNFDAEVRYWAERKLSELEIEYRIQKRNRHKTEPRILFLYFFLLDLYIASDKNKHYKDIENLLILFEKKNSQIYQTIRKHYESIIHKH